MSYINQRPCPHCGVRERQNVPGRIGWYDCPACGTRYSFGNDKNEQAVFLEDSRFTINGKPLGRALLELNKWFNRLSILIVLCVVAYWLGLWGSSYLNQSRAKPVAEKDIPVLGTTVFEREGKQNFIRVFESEESGQLLLQTVVDDLQSGTRLASPQTFRFPAGSRGEWAQFRQFSDGQLYLLLQRSRFLSFNPLTHEFTDFTQGLQQLFPKELSSGVDSIEFQGPQWPDALLVQSGGQTFYINWLAQLIVPQAQAAGRYAQTTATSTLATPSFGFASNGEGNKQGAYLVRYVTKGGSGQMMHVPALTLYSQETAQKAQYEGYQPIGQNFALRQQDADSPGLILVEPVAPMKPMRNGEVLAMNQSRALIAFESDEPSQQGQAIELIDTSSKLVVWRQSLRDIPQLAQRPGGVQLQADPAGKGFYLRNGYVTPVLLIDNDGKTQYDFTQAPTSTSASTSSRGLGAIKDLLKPQAR